MELKLKSAGVLGTFGRTCAQIGLPLPFRVSRYSVFNAGTLMPLWPALH